MRTPLISAAELRRELQSNRNLVLLDARSSAADYAAGHLPGAHHADLNRDLSAATEPDADPAHGGRHPLPAPERWLATLAKWGIGPYTEVVAYDDQSGANAAARAWWMLRSIGHERAAVLDGGYTAALAASIEPVTDVPEKSARAAYPGSHVWQWPSVDLEAVDRVRRDAGWKVLDVRSGERYRGESETLDPVAGHIPGAVNLYYGENLSASTFKAPEELRAQYGRLFEGTPPERVVVHCGSGVTACHTLLALEAAGLHGASLYVGSWSEWCRRKAK